MATPIVGFTFNKGGDILPVTSFTMGMDTTPTHNTVVFMAVVTANSELNGNGTFIQSITGLGIAWNPLAVIALDTLPLGGPGVGGVCMQIWWAGVGVPVSGMVTVNLVRPASSFSACAVVVQGANNDVTPFDPSPVYPVIAASRSNACSALYNTNSLNDLILLFAEGYLVEDGTQPAAPWVMSVSAGGAGVAPTYPDSGLRVYKRTTTALIGTTPVSFTADNSSNPISNTMAIIVAITSSPPPLKPLLLGPVVSPILTALRLPCIPCPPEWTGRVI